MNAVFLKLLNMGLTASWLVLAVLVLRLVLKKAPRWILCLLWGVVALRLVLPVTFESGLSLVPSGEVIPRDITVSQAPAIHSGISAVNSAVNPSMVAQVAREQISMEQILHITMVVWAVGVMAMLLYSAISYLVLRWRVRVSLPVRDRVYACDEVDSAFILGVIRPRIYIPSGMEEKHLRHVLAHEYAHLARRDHWWKPLAFLLLSVYWFNPLLWLAYILLCRDIEKACDEKVVARMDANDKRGYSEALLASSLHRRMVFACPVAFGEVGVKARIRGVLSYRKPAFWVVVAAGLVCTVTAVCFLTNPIPCAHAYEQTETIPATCAERGMQTLCCKKCGYTCAEPLHMTAHSYDDGVIIEEPNCLHTGVILHTCTDCGVQKTEELAIAGHTAGKLSMTKVPTCSQEGEISSGCTVCHVQFVAEILPFDDDHDLQETVVREATCSAAGEGIRKCTRCGYSEVFSYEKLPHNYQKGQSWAGNCTYPGKQQMICACGAEYLADTVEEPSIHAWKDMGGDRQDRCSLCGVTKPYNNYVPKYNIVTDEGSSSGKIQIPTIEWPFSGTISSDP